MSIGRIGDAGGPLNLGGAGRLDQNGVVDRLITELLKAVITQMMMGGAQGAPQGLGGAPDQFAGLGGGGGCGAARDAATAANAGALPQIVGNQGGCGCVGGGFEDPLAVRGGFDAGQLFAGRLHAAVPEGAAPIGDPAQGAAVDPGQPQLLAANAPGAPNVFDQLNVNQDLRQWTTGCGAKGCCKWEPAIA
jgi:hypothetical protein